MNMMYLIQRGTFRTSIESQKNHIDLEHCDLLGNNKSYISLDYMGAAEFEYGALPRSLETMARQWEDNGNKFIIKPSSMKTLRDVPLNIVAKDEEYFNEAEAEIAKYLKDRADVSNIPSYRLKEHINLEYYMIPWFQNNDWHRPNPITNFWWDIGNDFMFFTGAEDRLNLFTKKFNKLMHDTIIHLMVEEG